MSKREARNSVEDVTDEQQVKRKAIEEDKEEAAETQQQPVSEWMVLRNESHKWIMKSMDPTLSRKEIAFMRKEGAAVEWKLGKLQYPANFNMLRAARERLIEAELEYIKAMEMEDLFNKIAGLDDQGASASAPLKEAYVKDLALLLSEEKEVTNFWARREIDLREQISKRNPLPRTCHVPMTWEDISAAISMAPFAINTLLDDESSQRAVLGPLFKEGSTWPVVRTSTGLIIDMKFMPHRFFNPDGDVLRPAARRICDMILNSNRPSCVSLGVSGSGKSSALVDVGREHFVIYFQLIPPIDLKGEWGYGVDHSFARMYLDLCERTSLDNTTSAVHENDKILRHRALVELVTRILQLVRLYREVGTNLTPWMFTVHQLACTDQDFLKEMVCYLDTCDTMSLENIVQEAKKELAPLFAGLPRFIIAIDDCEFAMELLKERFKPPSDPEGEFPKSIVSGIYRAASHLRPFERIFFVFSGSGLPVKNVPRGPSRTSIGKREDNFTVAGLLLFPVCQKEDIVGVLSCLNVSEELRSLMEDMCTLSWPLHLPSRKGFNTQESIKYLMEDYVIDARHGVLCGVIESIKECIDDSVMDESSIVAKLEGQSEIGPNYTNNNNKKKTVDELLLMSIQKTLKWYRECISWYLEYPLLPDYLYVLDEKEKDEYLHFLLSVIVTMKLTNGKTKIVRKEDPNTRLWTDLVRRGIAIDFETHSLEQSYSEFFSYSCRERIAVEAIELLFSANEQVLNSSQIASHRRILDTLSSFLEGFNKEEGIFRGSLMDNVVFNRLIALQHECPTVGDLPFLPSNLDASWKSIPFNLQGIKQATDERVLSSTSTPDFLISQTAENVIYVPEKICGPDGIVMLSRTAGLSQRRAIAFSIALYSCRVPESDARRQNYSTDLSRSYLNSSSRKIRSGTEQLRGKWIENGLHETLALRVLIQLPYAPRWNVPVYERKTKVEGASNREALQTLSVEDDVIVRLDCSNIHLLLGPVNETNHVLYDLLMVATDVTDGWCIRNNVCSNLKD